MGIYLNYVFKGLSTAVWSRDAKDMRCTSTQLSIVPAQPRPLAWSLLSHHHHDSVLGDLEGSLILDLGQQYLQCREM